MRKLFFLFSIIFFQFSYAQEQVVEATSDDNLVYNSSGIEVKPEYPGGIEAFYKHVANHFVTPEHKNFKGGKILVSFVVEKDGTLTDIKVLRDAGFGTAEETIRVLKNAKTWQPAEQNGKKVRCSYMLPITIQPPK
ncbi:energy transducer TonB [Flavobacterium sp.]|uniref:energy transducer TonB n=1 Tax=Flavobacterium sp. TaxID=239 RepID=UPI00260BAC23|nr:energy transducer TonB [Flavobacterium sp.]